MSGLNLLSRWLLFGEWRAHPMRALLAIVAIAVGVAMGFAIHIINAAAFNEFTAATKTLSGQADVQVSGRERLFDEAIYARLATMPGVEVASPVLLVKAGVPGQGGELQVVGIDAFRAGAVTPGLVGMGNGGNMMDILADDAIFLSPAAASWLQRQSGGAVQLRSGTRTLTLRVAGGMPQARRGQRIAMMDIGAAQWRFERVGKLSRIDLKLQAGVNRDSFQQSLAQTLEREFPGRFRVEQPNDENQESRNSGMSRAYRVNLTVLALVALFTGAFLVFSTQALSVIRRRSQFALLRVLGVERKQLLRQVLLEGTSLGLVGALLGIGSGYALAATALHYFGADLGAGLFAGVRPEVAFPPLAAAVFFALGLGVAVLGCMAPAIEASRAAPAVALKSGNDEAALSRLTRIWPSMVCLALASVLAFAPPVFELPLFGYIAIGLLLVGGIGLMPRLAASVFGVLNGWSLSRVRQRPVQALTLARLANASGQAGIALGGVLSSFSLMVAMAIMVSSFRVSVDDWVLRLLPADLYVRVKDSGGGLGLAEQATLKALPGVRRIEFMRSRPLSLDAARPDVALLARSVNMDDPGASMALEGFALPVPAGTRPAWVSEAMLDLYAVKVGNTLQVPLNGRLHPFFVAGVVKDYANQAGSIYVRIEDYRALSADQIVSDAGIWASDESSADKLETQVRTLPFGDAVEFAKPGEIRAMTMMVFDRSFAVTYLLEAIAIGIGLIGIGATFSAQTLARAKEFGMLRHVGVTRGQIMRILALEGGALSALGVACGFALGLVISLILIFVVNPQSFHWSMKLHLPWPLLASVAGALLVASVITALVSGRQALSGGPIRAVREDW